VRRQFRERLRVRQNRASLKQKTRRQSVKLPIRK
jgi:hypothetical protein